MTNLARCTVAAAAAIAVIAPVTVASTAHASIAVKRWTTIETIALGKQQACKVSSNLGTAWTIYNRLDTHAVKAGSGPLEATLRVTYQGKPTTRFWDSKYVTPGHYSTVGTVVLPRRAGWYLTMTIHGTDFGNGGEPKIASIGLC